MRIEVRNLRKEFGSAIAVKDASFTIAEPMMVGVIGRSGAGKSTLLRMLNRLTPATAGEALVDGTDVLSLSGAEMRRWQRDCAMIFQQFNLVPRLDVLTNVMLGRLNGQSLFRSLFSLFSEAEVEEALRHLDRLGIAEQAVKRAEALSGGQQQRVAIARALMQNPVMMLADEPIASLDPLNAKHVMDALREICSADRKTVICNLHTLDTARAYCDRVIGMRFGEIVYDGSPSGLSPAVVREVYGSDEDIDEATTSTAIGAGGGASGPAAASAASPY